MKGLIYENFYLLKKQFLLSGVLLLLSAIMSYLISPYIFYSISTILVSMLPITAMVYENESKLTKIILSMPIERKDFVNSKYISTLILGVINFFINLIFMLLVTQKPLQSLIFSAVSFIIGMTVMNIMFPLIFKYGVEKAKFILGCIIAVFAMICFMAYKFKSYLPSINNSYLLLIILIFPIIFFIISRNMSIRVFERAELS